MICLAIQNLKEFSFEKYPFEGYELKFRSEGFKFNILKVLELKEKFKGHDLSVHSQLSRIFSCSKRGCPEFNEAELDLLKAEIVTSQIIGIRQIIFHLKQGLLTEEEKARLREIIDFAKQKGIEMIYESKCLCEAKTAIALLEDFPEVNYCLDFGHINTSLEGNRLGMDLMEFIDKIQSRIVYIHAHNNNGEEDTHNSLDSGTFPWRKVLDKLKDSNLKKVIIECKPKNSLQDDILDTKKLLEDYYSLSE